MYIESIRLRDWKAYVDATFEFPKPTKKKNVVLIGAMNGYGKTSLLEALILGLFGRDGLGILGRAIVREGEPDRLSYDNFLERALHAHALEQGRQSVSVSITVSGADDTITIERRWHFSSSGKHRREDEEVRVWIGPDKDLVKIPRPEERDDFLRTFVPQRFLPVHLAQFFLFDGEQVQRLAQRDMSSQVRLGIEGMLGVPVLRELSQDLLAYARERRHSTAKGGSDTLERLRTEVHELETAVQESEGALATLSQQIEPLRTRRDQIVKELGSRHRGSYANLREFHEKKGKLERDRDREEENLAALMREDLALSLAGSGLRTRLVARLTAEEERSKWEYGQEQSAGGLARLLGAFEVSDVEPPLTSHQTRRVRERIRVAWEDIWHPPSTSVDHYRHTYLGSSDRTLVLERLRHAATVPLKSIGDMLSAIRDFDTQIHKVDSQIARAHGISEKELGVAAELDALTKQLSDLDEKRRELVQVAVDLTSKLTPRKEDLARLLEGHQRAQPQLRRAAVADKISELIEVAIKECYPLHIAELSVEMTTAYKALAHKTLVKSITIEPDCTVKLHGDQGRDMGNMDASAGENQIFALSLIAAIGRSSGREFPIVMDTPLARLDSVHRLNVLRYFTDRFREQVILLSQPDEVSGQYLDAIRDRVSVAYRIDHEELGNGVGQSRASRNCYFEEV
jgi:DNA sulfur modification protein DndD